MKINLDYPNGSQGHIWGFKGHRFCKVKCKLNVFRVKGYKGVDLNGEAMPFFLEENRTMENIR